MFTWRVFFRNRLLCYRMFSSPVKFKVSSTFCTMPATVSFLRESIAVLSNCVDNDKLRKSYVNAFNACRKSKDISIARLLHAFLTYHHPHLIDSVGESLVLTLAKSGSVEDGRVLLLSLSNRSSISWTALISAYTESGSPFEALRTYVHMQQDSILPDIYTFVSLFKACGSIPDLQEGRRLHVEVEKKGFTSNAFVGSSLVNMYGKCGCILEAENLFCNMSHRDDITWSTLLSVYIDRGLGFKALWLYRQMKEEGQGSYGLLLVLAVQACSCVIEEERFNSIGGSPAKAVALNIGRALHCEAHMLGSALNAYLGSALVSMYGKCGAIDYAEYVFLELCVHDVVLWNSMLTAYVEQGQAIKALLLYKQMNEERIFPNKLTLILALQACAAFADQEEIIMIEQQPHKMVSSHIAEAFYNDIARKSLLSDEFLGSSIANLFGKCGNLGKAQYIFSGLSQHNVVTWTMILSMYMESGCAQKGLEAYRMMHENGILPDKHAMVASIQACGMLLEKEDFFNLSVLEIIQALHAEVRVRGFSASSFVASSLISVYGKCGSIHEALNVFLHLPRRDVVVWTAILSVYLEQGQADKVLQLYSEMQRQGIDPDQHVFVVVLQACGTFGDIEECLLSGGQLSRPMALEIGKALHEDAFREGYTTDTSVCTGLLSMYGKCGDIQDAENVFNSFSHFSVLACTAMVSVYVEQGYGDKALELYRDMLGYGVTLDYVIIICILKACSLTGSLGVCRQIHFRIVSSFLDSDLMLLNAVIHAYGSCGNMLEAQYNMGILTQPDLVSWNTCITGYAQEGNILDSLETIESMQLEGIVPDITTFLLLFRACSHTGLVEKGCEYFETMVSRYDLHPESRHHVAMIDTLGRSGQLERLKEIMTGSSIEFDIFGWICFLGACYKHNNLDLGKQIFDYVVTIQPKAPVAYVLMSNIYAYEILE